MKGYAMAENMKDAGPVVVLFEVTIREGRKQDYLDRAASLKEELAKADGFLGSERFESLSTPGKVLSKSLWRNEQCVEAWRNLVAHRMAQLAGRKDDFTSYRITVATSSRVYTMDERKEAPRGLQHVLWAVICHHSPCHTCQRRKGPR